MATSSTDDELMKRISEGDKVAFHELFNRHAGHMIGYAQRYLKSAIRSEEVTQEIWMKVIKLSPSYKGSNSFVAWIYTMIRHMCLNIMREENRLVAFDDPQTSLAQEEVSPQNLENELLTKQSLAQTKLILERMPDSQRVALLLYVVEELSYEEIATELSTSLTAVKSLIYRARQQLGAVS